MQERNLCLQDKGQKFTMLRLIEAITRLGGILLQVNIKSRLGSTRKLSNATRALEMICCSDSGRTNSSSKVR